MKIHPFPLFAGIHTGIATVLTLSSASRAQNIFSDMPVPEPRAALPGGLGISACCAADAHENHIPASLI
jgi:hypothetical protein